ncbi:branched-chain amino acid ABC transporter permease [Rhodococcus oxybenzonivorans]|uniref:branched-chain amino acid ABC transporter permease n=1 Tax=Rhodococcus oxybenzonivorans TaxID=1990687 RepID=UPI0029548F78|nr:branched-chain amino acid ABC transporter permease [Rhodococcus oxybenzonivorans]MDV7353626.1 branched-chain amino acid ABC transporter permease [Rhodococcus oxybenzonivorans]
MDTLVALSFSAAAYGAVLALAALGFLVLYKATGVVNFAHGDLITLSGYIALWFITDLDSTPVVGYVLAVGIMFLIGMGLERLAYAPLRRRPHLTVLIATLAAALVIRAFISLWQGSTPQRLPSPADGQVVTVLGAPIAGQRILILVVALLCIAAVMYIFGYSSFGRQLRALASDPETAEMYGVRTGRISLVAWGLSAGLAALAGILVAPLSSLDLNFGFTIMLAAFAAAVLGGFGNLWGVLLGSLLIGTIQYLIGGYVLQDYASILPYIAMLAILGLRPQGLLGRTVVRL